jgi:DNA-binding HxlR family transcriptional regulator
MRHPQFCALARAAEIVGERWTLLIVRELLIGPRRFTDLRAGLGGVSTSVLAARLEAMERTGLVRGIDLPAPAATRAYELTPAGEALRPAVHELIRWGGRFLFPARPGDDFDPRWVVLALQACARRGPSPRRSFTVRVKRGGRESTVAVTGGRSGTKVRDGALAEEDARVSGRFEALLSVIAGAVPPGRAVSAGLLELTGSREAFREFPKMFEVASHVPDEIRTARQGAKEE